MTKEKSLLEMLDEESNRIKNYWISHWERIKGYDVVVYTEYGRGGLEYFLASPKAGFKVKRRDCVTYYVVLKEPYVKVIFYWKDNQIAKKSPPSIKEAGGLYLLDRVTLLGKDQICKHLEDLAKQDKFNVDSKEVLTAMEETIQKLAELRQQL